MDGSSADRGLELYLAEGVLIAQVEPHSPAHDAGLRKGDIIEEAGGKRINDPSDISSLVRKKHVREELAVTINRYGKHFEISIQLQARP